MKATKPPQTHSSTATQADPHRKPFGARDKSSRVPLRARGVRELLKGEPGVPKYPCPVLLPHARSPAPPDRPIGLARATSTGYGSMGRAAVYECDQPVLVEAMFSIVLPTSGFDSRFVSNFPRD